MLELTALDKSFGSRRLLSDASLVIRAGECVALIGANGSGKTTTLRCAIGLARPDRGNVRIDGIDMRTRPVDARARVSYLAQRTDFPSTLTVREILTVVADLRRADPRAVDREIAMCGLTRLASRTVGQLSGGERQRVAMAALFIPDAAVYLLDEPTMNLDPAGAGLLIDRLTEVRDKGRAILFTTHVAAGLEGLATRVAALRNGRIDDLRHECSLAAALERLHQEGARHETEAADSGAVGIPHRDVWQQLWRGAWWPGTDSAGSRQLRTLRHVDFERCERCTVSDIRTDHEVFR